MVCALYIRLIVPKASEKLYFRFSSNNKLQHTWVFMVCALYIRLIVPKASEKLYFRFSSNNKLARLNVIQLTPVYLTFPLIEK